MKRIHTRPHIPNERAFSRQPPARSPRFIDAFGIYAEGMAETTALLPLGWRGRLVKVQNDNTNNAIRWCLDPTDLVIAKHVAGRPKDLAFTAEMVRRGMIAADVFHRRLDTLTLAADHRQVIRDRFNGQLAERDRQERRSPRTGLS